MARIKPLSGQADTTHCGEAIRTEPTAIDRKRCQAGSVIETMTISSSVGWPDDGDDDHLTRVAWHPSDRAKVLSHDIAVAHCGRYKHHTLRLTNKECMVGNLGALAQASS